MLGKDNLTIFVPCANIHFVSLNLDSNNWLYGTCKVFLLYSFFFFASAQFNPCPRATRTIK